DLKNQLNIPSTDTSQDTELTVYLNASNEIAESLIGPSSDTTFTELYGSSEGAIILMRRPLISVTSVTPLNGTVLPTTAYTVDKHRGGLVINAGGNLDYTVVYHAGWSGIPARGLLGPVIIAQHLWETQRGGMNQSVVTAEELVSVPGMSFALPKRAIELLGSAGGPSMVPGIA